MEKGFMMDQDGVVTKFGILNGIGSTENSHKNCFEREIVNTAYFESLGIEYDFDSTVYTNAENLSRQGIILVFNHQLNSVAQTQITAYMPINPTKKQIQSLRLLQPKIDQIKIKKLYELHSNNYNDALEYSSFLDYLDSKVRMKEKGIVIFKDGTTLPFGNYVCPDEPKYLMTPTHASDFIHDIVSSSAFKLSNYVYDDTDDDINLYRNLLRFSLDGLITIVNNQKSSTGPTEILCYVTSDPTEEQLSSLEQQKKVLDIEIQNVCEFCSYDYDDYIKYDDLRDYINKKRNVKTN